MLHALDLFAKFFVYFWIVVAVSFAVAVMTKVKYQSDFGLIELDGGGVFFGITATFVCVVFLIFGLPDLWESETPSKWNGVLSMYRETSAETNHEKSMARAQDDISLRTSARLEPKKRGVILAQSHEVNERGESTTTFKTSIGVYSFREQSASTLGAPIVLGTSEDGSEYICFNPELITSGACKQVR